jgi:hypothetical protein
MPDSEEMVGCRGVQSEAEVKIHLMERRDLVRSPEVQQLSRFASLKLVAGILDEHVERRLPDSTLRSLRPRKSDKRIVAAAGDATLARRETDGYDRGEVGVSRSGPNCCLNPSDGSPKPERSPAPAIPLR